jgi:hypothetical protein
MSLKPEERTVWFESLCAAGNSVVPGKICIAENIAYTQEQLQGLFKVPALLLSSTLQKLASPPLNRIILHPDGIIEICDWEHYAPNSFFSDFALPVSPSYNLRLAVLNRDNWTCLKCGEVDHLEIDHILAWTDSGKTVYDNLQILCKKCNANKRTEAVRYRKIGLPPPLRDYRVVPVINRQFTYNS